MKSFLSLVMIIFLLWGGNAGATSTLSNSEEFFGVRENAGEAIIFQHLGKKFTIKINELILPELGGPFLNPSAVTRLADILDSQVSVKEQDAYIDEHGKVVEHLSGVALDRLAFQKKLHSFLFEETELVETLPVKFTPPRVTTEQLKTAMEKQISSFATYYNSGNKNRSYNIKLASNSINHYVLNPGETFSFNRVVGKRTSERGYKRAPVIVRGELSEGIGGGICQVSSTLFNAADRAGLTIVKRYSHSKRVSYVPSGRDATVSWYGPDFVFRNDYDYPIMIKCYAGNGQNFVAIYSSRRLAAELRETPEAPKKLPKEVHDRSN
ncbi:VanW family protein [Ammoniphilus resinae]|uniref:Vancomycin resistance protein YoaR n=1 Tax=Ammoniphilus resinae TaxID=861532 RepID=A0ABS4GL15_9BACL|nr:VanW family protein [Ammoniphilus resinae]MBP1930595.1 vancomycin resistance protein YoaR [Ammoniphilus resinae]